ncbi:5'-3' exonuclease H3TH domain-containing protein [Jatrophihabitans sp.]|uniref:5'-3' exonuclease n=1 Tax=Jatrophihabitans sp. TaxID=1932789 RepID=UPI00391708C3
MDDVQDERGDAAPVVLVIDGNSLVHRSFHAQARTASHTADGRPCWAVRGLLMQLVAAVDRIRPAAVVVGFDDPGKSVRRDRWPTYKATRVDKLDSLIDQLQCAVEVLRELGVAVVVPPGLEADDVLASTAAQAARLGATAVVVTSDRDAFALIDDTTRVLRIINGGVEASPLMNADRLVMLLGIRPEQYRDYAALRGDPSDNLPGVRGIGPRTAARLLQEFGSAAAAFADRDAVRTKFGAGLAAKLADPAARAAWELNCQVMTMHADVPMDLDLVAGPGVLPLPADAVARVFREHQLVWSVNEALCVLASADPDRLEQPRAPLPSWIEPSDGFARPRLPKLPARRPEPAQLSLFD